jgi:hypothetical protein
MRPNSGANFVVVMVMLIPPHPRLTSRGHRLGRKHVNLRTCLLFREAAWRHKRREEGASDINTYLLTDLARANTNPTARSQLHTRCSDVTPTSSFRLLTVAALPIHFHSHISSPYLFTTPRLFSHRASSYIQLLHLQLTRMIG